MHGFSKDISNKQQILNISGNHTTHFDYFLHFYSKYTEFVQQFSLM